MQMIKTQKFKSDLQGRGGLYQLQPEPGGDGPGLRGEQVGHNCGAGPLPAEEHPGYTTQVVMLMMTDGLY